MGKKVALFAGMVGYVLVLTLVLLVARFPRERFMAGIEAGIVQRLPGCNCRIGKVSYRFPFGFEAGRSRLACPDSGIDLKADSISISIDPKRPLSHGSFTLQLNGSACAGDIVYDRGRNLIEIPAVKADGIDLAAAGEIGERLGRPVTGHADFAGSATVPLADPLSGILSGTVHAHDVTVALRRPILGQDSLTFESVDAEISASAQTILIGGGEAAGPVLRGQFSGDIALFAPWWDSTLSLVGAVVPEPSFVRQRPHIERMLELLKTTYGPGPIPCVVLGTVNDPVFHFGVQGDFPVDDSADQGRN